jgi:3-hexulose-6-phosphate synthase/6-phospho-3-hexuloisomerase
MGFVKPVLQVALDFLELSRALRCAREAVEGGADWIEAGTPLIKSAGLDAVRALRREFPDRYLVADLKTMDAGRMEVEAAAKAGANCATVLGAAGPATLEECVEAGRNMGIDICVDLIQAADPAGAARRAAELGVRHVSVHCPIDAQMQGQSPWAALAAVREAVTCPVAVAGGLNTETAADAVARGAEILIVGGAITKAPDAAAAARAIRRAMDTGEKIASPLFKRGTEADLRELFLRVSTPNLSDAMHRSGELAGLAAVTPGGRMAGPAFTVRTFPGDWAKPVEAIEHAPPGAVIVIDAGGVPPAVWGELASESCLQRGVVGVVIDGAIRDVDEIRRMKFPAFARGITPAAGEPKGLGEMQIAVRAGGRDISPGDWIVGDDSGVVRVPRARAVETANRAMHVLEMENRIREEIRRHSTLSQVVELAKWEKQLQIHDPKNAG